MFAGFSSLSAYKIVMAISFPLSAFFAYLWLSRRFGTWPGIAAGFIYSLAPYHFANVYVRGAIGETVAAMMLPLSFYALDLLGSRKSRRYLALAAIFIAIVILSHPFYGLVFSFIWIMYAAVNKWPRYVILSIIGGYMISSFYIIPAYVYKNLTYLDRIENFFLEKQDFVTLPKLINSPWGFAAVAEVDKDPMSVQIGATALVLCLGAAYLFFKEKNKPTGLFLGLIVFAVFMMLPVSLPLWQVLSPLRALQFPWRLLFVVNVSMAFCAGYFLSHMKRTAVLTAILVVVVLFASRGFWSVGRYYPESDLNDMNKTIGYPGILTMLLEETPKWHVIQQESNPYTFFNVQSGLAGVKNLVWKTNYHKFVVTAEKQSVINDKTHYWPGWKVFVDGEEVKLIDPYSKLSQGTLAFEVTPGTHVVESRLSEPPLNLIADTISLLSLGLCLVLILKKDANLA